MLILIQIQKMIKRLLLILHILTSAYLLSAQYVNTEKESNTQVKRNSIGLIINPVVSVFLGSSPYDMRAGILYRRRLTDYKSLRFSGAVQFKEAMYDRDNYVSGITDSTIQIIYPSDSYFRTEARIGIEWSDYTSNSDSFYAIELIAGHISNTESSRKIDYQRVNNAAYPVGVQLTDSIGYCTRVNSVVIGLAPVIGWRGRFREKWECMASISPEVYFTSPYKTIYCVDSSSGFEMNRSSSLDFRLRLLDLAISYHF